MAERTETRDRSTEGVEDLLGDHVGDFDAVGADGSTRGSGASATSSRLGGLRERLGSPVSGLFSLWAFATALVLTVAGLFVAGAVIPLLPSAITGLLGVAAAGFLLGAASDRRRYLEVGLAGTAVAAVAALLHHLVLTMLGVGAPLVVVGAGGGALAALAGHYLGRDLRAGLTREL
ncbi:MAG: hypothetical protein ABEJ31_08470 [Haloarculaceae archaeon]